MNSNQPAISSSSSVDDDPQPDPQPVADQSLPDEVTFGFNHLQIHDNDDSNPQKSTKTDEDDPEQEDDDDDDDDDDDGGDFTFVCVGDTDSPTSDQVSNDGEIRKVFPLFDQSLLLGGDYSDGKRRLPIDVPVDNVFIESPQRSPSAYGETAGTITVLSKDSGSGSPELNMKSNSTGFSKLWRFRNEMNRSNSDGRDAFVFLEPPATTSESKQTSVTCSVAGTAGTTGTTAKVNVSGRGKGVAKASKGKKSTPSAHEVYLKQKGEEDRRRSYLPYRPGVMGFFTNVNGGLSKNVHPF